MNVLCFDRNFNFLGLRAERRTSNFSPAARRRPLFITARCGRKNAQLPRASHDGVPKIAPTGCTRRGAAEHDFTHPQATRRINQTNSRERSF